MRGLTICLCFTVLILASCTGDVIETNKLTKTFIKPFSDAAKQDTFKVKVAGHQLKDMQIVFTINSFKGTQIYSFKIKASDLFKNYDATINLNKKKNQLKFLEEEIDRFFDDENFIEPAVSEQENPDQFVPDKAFYSELKKDQLNGFSFRLGKEEKIYIAWSQKEKKVKPYYICCK